MALGDTINKIGYALNLPEMGIGEKFGASPTFGQSGYGDLYYPNPTTGQTTINPSTYGAITSNVSVKSAPAPTTQPTPQPSGSSGGGGGINLKDPNANPGQGWFWDAADGWKQDGGAGQPDFSSYFASLDEQIAGLDPQRQSQEQIAQNTYTQGMNTLGSQLTQGKADLEANQQKTLRDLSENMRQSWQQGNAMLGTRGASDSSAANQYAYALTKYGNQQRGDVQSQYQAQLSKMQNVYDTESKNLELAKNSQLQQIAQWFADAQNQLRSVVGQGKLQQSQQAYNTALQMMQQAQQEASSRRSALDQWALNKANTYQEAAKAVGLMGQTPVSTPTFNGINSTQQQSTGNVGAGYGATDNKKYNFLLGRWE